MLLFQHWALYIGEFEGRHYAIHYSTERNDFGLDDKAEITSKLTLQGSSAHVRSDLISTIAAGSLCRINNSLDAQINPFPPAVIYERAIYRLVQCGYNLLYKNCEHFAKECRYGSAESDQVTLVSSVLGGVVIGAAFCSLPLAVVSGATAYTVYKYKKSIYDFIPKIPDFLTKRGT